MKKREFGVVLAILLVGGIGTWRLVWTGRAELGEPGRTVHASDPDPAAAAIAASRAAPDGAASTDAPQRRAEGSLSRLVAGKVVAAGSGGPIAGADVRLFDYARASDSVRRTDGSGLFAFAETRDREGLFRIAISHAEHGSPLEADARPAVEPLVYELRPGGVIRGRVVQAVGGAPVARYRIAAVRVPFQEDTAFDVRQALLRQTLPPNLRVAASLDVEHSDGVFELRGLAPQKFALIVTADGFQPAFYNGGGKSYENQRGVEPKSGELAEPVLIELLPVGDVFLRVLDAQSKEPILGAEVEVVVEVGVLRFPFRQRLDEPDASGRHRLRVGMTVARIPRTTGEARRAIDDLKLSVTRPGYAPWSSSTSGHEEGHTIVALLGRGGRVRGTVRAEDRRPVPGCVVLVEREVDRLVLASVRTAADGTYETGPLPAETELVLHCFAPSLTGVLAAVPLLLRHGELRIVDIGSAAGAIFGRVTMHGAPLALVLVSVEDKARRRTVVYTGDDGRFRLEGLAPGEYGVFCNASHAGGSLLAQRFVTLAEGRSAEVSIAFGKVIRGVALDAERDEPVRTDLGLELAARRAGAGAAEEREYVSAEIGEGGKFALYVTEAAQYELHLRDCEDWFLEDPPIVDLRTAGEVEVRVRVRPDPKSGKISLRIVDDATGEGVVNGWYQVGTTRSSGAGQFTNAVVEQRECTMGVYRFVVYSDHHTPVRVSVAITPAQKIVDQEVRLPRGDGVRVTEVTDGGTGWQAGLEPGDVIRTYNGAPVRNLAALRAAIEGAPPDAPVRLGIMRSGVPMTLSPRPGALGIRAETWRDGR